MKYDTHYLLGFEKIMEIYANYSNNFYKYFIESCQTSMNVFHPYEPIYNPEIMKNFPYNKFNLYVFMSYLFHLSFVLIKTDLGMYYFRWSKSLNTTVKIHGEKFLLTNPPNWVQIVHLVERKNQ